MHSTNTKNKNVLLDFLFNDQVIVLLEYAITTVTSEQALEECLFHARSPICWYLIVRKPNGRMWLIMIKRIRSYEWTLHNS